MRYKSSEREFLLRSANRIENPQQRYQLRTEGTEEAFVRSDVTVPNWLGDPSSVGTAGYGDGRSVIFGGHVAFGLAPMLAETLREPIAIRELRSAVRELNERLAVC
jgi:hypothetical protein